MPQASTWGISNHKIKALASIREIDSRERIYPEEGWGDVAKALILAHITSD